MPAVVVKSLPLTTELLRLTEKSYDEYNAVLDEIKSKLLDIQVATFEQVLAEELPLTTARRASKLTSKWSSMAVLPRPVTMMMF